MAPLFPLITLAFSILSPFAAFASWEDLNEYGASHRADMDRQHERQMQEYREAEQESNYRSQQDAARINEPTRYDSPSYTNPTPQFNLYQGNDPSNAQLCTASKYSVSCY